MAASSRVRTSNILSTGRFLSLLSSTALAAATALAPHSAGAVGANELPTGGKVVGGGATITQSASNKLDINQSTDRTVINWDTFNIGKNATTQFYQPNSTSLAVNRVTGAGQDPSKIEGSLKANGNVMVIDRNGVIFGKHSMINVNGIIASTGDVDTNAVMNGDKTLTLTNFGAGAIENKGTITAADAGLVGFVGRTVSNSGTINAKLGRVALAATGNTATIDLYGDGLVTLAPGGDTGKVLAANSGVINAAGGNVAISAAAAKGAVDDVINMDGIVDVSSISQKGGQIVLSGGDAGAVNVTGTLKASGKTGGGAVKVTGQNIKVGKGSAILADATDTGNGGSVSIKATGKAQFDGVIAARGGSTSGNGGQVEISGATLGYTGLVDTLAAHGKTGSLLLDPVDMTISNDEGDDGLTGNNVNAQDIANTLEFSDVDLAATHSITVSDNIDISTYQSFELPIFLSKLSLSTNEIGFPPFLFPSSGITTNTLTLAAPTVSINHDVTLGTGGLTVDASTLNLDGRIYQRGTVGGDTTFASASQLGSDAGTINVLSNNALIGQGLQFAAGGSTVNVAAGTYDEDLTLDKANVTLSGAGGQLTHLTPHSPGVVVTADNDTVEGLYITGASNGIFVDHAANAKILNNDVENSSANGIYFTGSTGGDVEGNTVTNTGSTGHGIAFEQGSDNGKALTNNVTHTGYNGIYSTGGTGMDFEGNIISQAGYTTTAAHGISIEEGSGKIVGNTIDSLSDGILLYDTTAPSFVTGNTINGAGRYGVAVIGSAGAKLNGNVIGNTGSYGIYDATSSTTDIESNNINHTGGDGIHLDHSDSAKILNNTLGYGTNGKAVIRSIHGNGIDLDTSNSATIQGNKIGQTQTTAHADANGSGIYINDSTGAVIGGSVAGQGNTISGVSWDGIKLVRTTGANATGNSVSNATRVALYGEDTVGTTVTGNTFTNTHLATQGQIWLDGGSNATVTNNTQSNAALQGIELDNLTGVNLVSNNTIDTVAGDGIFATGTAGLTVSLNHIGTGTSSTIGADGIDVVSSAGAKLNGNVIGNTGSYGIYDATSSTTDIESNNINHTGGDGIHLDHSDSAKILNNTLGYGTNGKAVIRSIHGNGIDLDTSNSATIQGNKIGQTQTTAHADANGSGIYINDSTGAVIGGSVAGQGNTISGVSWDGIKLVRTTGANATGNSVSNATRVALYGEDTVGTTVTGNTFTNTHLATQGQIWLDGGSNATVTNNTQSNAALQGIELDNLTGVNLVSNNTIDTVAGDGIFATGTAGLTVSLNHIGTGTSSTIGADGIDVVSSAGAKLNGNVIGNTGSYGIYDATSSTTDIESNNINHTGGDGIHLDHSDSAKILNNTLGYGTNGKAVIRSIHGNGIDLDTSNSATIQGNKIGQTQTTAHADANGSGIYINDSTGAVIGGSVAGQGNTISGVSWDGIKLVRTTGANATGNSVSNATRVALYGEDTVGTTVTGNTFTNTHLATQGQIWLDGGSNATVTNNTQSNAALQGIELDNLTGVNLVSNNTIDTVAGDGIFATGTAGLTVSLNHIGTGTSSTIGADGIDVVDSPATSISQNIVANTAGNGIAIDPSADSTVSGNHVNKAGGDGIYAQEEDGLTISGNFVDGSNENGIEVSGGSDIAVSGNAVTNSGADGIYVHDVGGEIFETRLAKKLVSDNAVTADSADVTITGNTVDFTGNNGIEVGNVDSSFIDGNFVGTAGLVEGSNIGGDGILVNGQNFIFDEARTLIEPIFPFGNSGTTTVTNNTVANTGDNGIEVDNLASADVETNTVDATGGDGITASNIGNNFFLSFLAEGDATPLPSGADLTIAGNFVGQTGFVEGNGISVYDSGSTVIGNNLIGASGGDTGPVLINDIRALDVIGENSVGGVGEDGIHVEDNTDDVTISGNQVTGATNNGIYLTDVSGVTVSSNLITGSGANGLFVAGPDNGSVSLSDNTFTDNPTGARFESGTIDLTGAANTFNGGDTALLFIPFAENTDGGGGEPAFTLAAVNADDTTTTFAPLTLVDNTIGTTIFNGQSTNYVEFANGAFFAPGTPTIINGLNATYDGYNPSAVNDGAMSTAQYDSIESKVFHYVDDQTLGLLFFGFIDDTGPGGAGDGGGTGGNGGTDVTGLDIGENDIFTRISGYRVGPHAFRVTLRGLPLTNVSTQTPGGSQLNTSAALLNDVSPSAGGNTPPAQSAADAALIEPSSGGKGDKTAGCWSEAVSNAAQGFTTSYSFGGSFAGAPAGGCRS